MQTNNIKYWKWAVVLLSVLNLFTIGSLLYHYYQEKNEPKAVVINNGAGNALNKQFFRYQVGFDEDQMDKFRTINRTYNPVANDIVLTIDSLKNALFTELNKTPRDSAKLETLSNQIGEYHAQLKKNTNNYYLQIQSIATPEQQETIKQAFLPLFKDENLRMRGNGRGWGNGEGRGRHHRGGRN